MNQNESVETQENTSLPDTYEFLAEKEIAFPSNLSILVYEEDEMSRLLIGYILYHSNISFQIALSGAELREKLGKKMFNLVIAGINGNEPDLSAVFKKNIPVLVVTASSGDKEIKHYLESGCEYVLAEPFEEKIFIQLIRTHMKNPSNNPEINATERDRIPSFSLEPLQKVCKNDNAFVLKMLDKFKISVQECTDGLQTGDATKIRAAAHKSIPSYSIMGLDPVMRDLAFIEHHIENEADKDQVNTLIRSVLERNQDILHDADIYISQLKQKVST